jgi:hypothetical protein
MISYIKRKILQQTSEESHSFRVQDRIISVLLSAQILVLVFSWNRFRTQKDGH